jgi:hypothetical protein
MLLVIHSIILTLRRTADAAPLAILALRGCCFKCW